MGVSAKPQRLAFLQSDQVLKVPLFILLWIVGGLSRFTLLSYSHYTIVQCSTHPLPRVVLSSWVPSLSNIWNKTGMSVGISIPFLIPILFLRGIIGPQTPWQHMVKIRTHVPKRLNNSGKKKKKKAHLWSRDSHLTYLYVVNTYMGHRGPSICHASYSLHQQGFLYIYKPSILFFSL